jgi:glycine cleavage system H protein
MSVPYELRYHPEHTWVRVDGSIVTIGITDFAQSQLGEIMFVNLPSVGRQVEQGISFGEVESAKTVSDLISPVTGEITEVNKTLDDDVELINTSPYEEGWMIKVQVGDTQELKNLLSADQYEKVTKE